jgi:hypothetical protein
LVAGMKRPARSAKWIKMLPDSKTGTAPPGASWSTIAGMRLFGLMARNSGLNWSPAPMFTGITR